MKCRACERQAGTSPSRTATRRASQYLNPEPRQACRYALENGEVSLAGRTPRRLGVHSSLPQGEDFSAGGPTAPDSWPQGRAGRQRCLSADGEPLLRQSWAALREGWADSRKGGLFPEPGPGTLPVSFHTPPVSRAQQALPPLQNLCGAPPPAGSKNPDTSARLARPAIPGFYFCSCILVHGPLCAPSTPAHLQPLPSTLTFPRGP